MSRLGEFLGQSMKNTEEIRPQIGDLESQLTELVILQKALKERGKAIRLKERDVTPDTLWGTSTWNGAVWDGTFTNARVTVTVVSPNDTFIEKFVDEEFIDTGNTTAIVNTSEGRIQFE